MKRIAGVSALLSAAIAVVAISYHSGEASDHDDGEQPDKSRELNLTDHFAFKSPSSPDELSLITYFNPRSLPQRQYFMNVGARYEQHVTKIGDRLQAATGKDDLVFRFEAVGAPDGNGVQQVKLTVLKDQGGTLTEAGSMMGSTTSFAGSSNNTNLTVNTGTVGGLDVKWFIGQRADSFHFDVARFFEVRAFLAKRLFGGPGGATGDATATLADNCRGDKFLALLLPGGAAANEAGGVPDADTVNLFNPPSCAPDFTKGLNVTAIVLNAKINQLGGTVFDTWSTISVPK
ncbi:MAG: DUF4331 family protein [Deltaproteobacteria bacterium]|nr:DUF4331 family protein [Deltaproteobacteria bacterium]MCW5803693.1 DUF4331 family protein [Deltaproteobacteria bacterium]